MTEIKITRHGQPLAVGGAAESSSRAVARDEDSSAPTTGRPASTAPGHAGSAGSPAAFGAGEGPGATGPGAAGPGSTGPSSPGASSSARASAAGSPLAGHDAPAAGGPASDTAGTDGAGATSSGATAHEEDAHAPAGEHTPTQDAETERVEDDLTELLQKAKQRDEYLALAQRTQADFENYRKRVAKDAHAAKERGVCALAKELLPALDNLDRALEAAAEDDPLLQGVRLARSELAAGLARLGIESFSPQGEQFDPEVHEAVATAPASDGQASGTVSEVYQAGYRLGETVIRPARVVVAA